MSAFERLCRKLGPRAYRWGFNVYTFMSWAPHPIEYMRYRRTGV